MTGTIEQIPPAEVVGWSPDASRIVAQNAGDGISLVDSTDLTDANQLANFNISDASAGPQPTSAAFSKDGRYLLGAFSTDGPTEFGALIVLDTAGDGLREVRRIPLRGQPDAIALSPDGRFAAIAIEDEDEEIANVGIVYVVELVDQDDPHSWIARDVEFTMDATYPDNTEPQPEYVAFNADNEIAFSIQEQNAIGIIDAEATADGDPATDPVERIFGVGRAVFNDDTVTNDQTFNFAPSPATISDQPREPDAVAWTEDGEAIVAVAEGENANPQEWFIVDRDGSLIFSSGVAMQRDASLFGLNADGRNEPEGVTVFRLNGTEYALIVIERAAHALVYDIDDRTSPKLVTAVPTGERPETVSFNVARRAAITGNEQDEAVPISAIRALERSELDPDRPQIKGDQPWYNLRGLTAESGSTLLAISADRPRRLRRIEVTARGEARLTTLGAIPGATTGLGNGAEDVVPDGSGGAWVAGLPSGAGPEIEQMALDGTSIRSIDLPDDLDPAGITRTPDGEHLIVIETSGDAGRITIADGSLERFTVTAPTPPAGQFTDLATAPDGRIIALRADANSNGLGAGQTALLSFPADAAAGSSVAATPLRTITRAQQTQMASDRRTALAITATGDAWTAHGAAFGTQVGGDPDLWRISGAFAPAPPAPPADRGIPSSIPAQPLVGLDYLQAGGQLYATGGGPDVIVSRLGVPSGPTVLVSPATGETSADGHFPIEFEGLVFSASPDGTGGFYATVNATTFNGKPIPGRLDSGQAVVHVRGDGTLDPGFTSPQLNSTASFGTAVFAGGRLWVSGNFTAVNGTPRTGLVALTPSGAVDPSIDIPVVNIGALEPRGDKLYIRGASSMTLGGQPRPHVGRIDLAAETPAVDGWNPQPNNGVSTIAVDGTRTFIGGAFTTLGGQPAQRLAATDPTGTVIHDFAANAQVTGMAAQGRRLFITGPTSINGAASQVFSHIDLDDLDAPAGGMPAGLAATSATQDPKIVPLADGGLALRFINGPFNDDGDVTVLNGDLTPRASFVSRNRAGTGATFDELAPGKLLVGGSGTVFGFSGPTERLLRVDPETGEADPSFAPPAAIGEGRGMIADERSIYVPIDEDLNNGVARLDRRTGELDPSWRVRTDEFQPGELRRVDSRLFLLRDFTSVEGSTRPGIAAVDAATGDLLAFNPRTNKRVDSMATGNGRLFLAGRFTRAAGEVVGAVIEVDPQTGALLDTFKGVMTTPDTAFSANWPTLAYDAEAERLYVGGVTAVDGAPAGQLAAFDVSGERAQRVAAFAPQLSRPPLNLAAAFGGLLATVATSAELNGTTLTTGAVFIDGRGELDPRFRPTARLRGADSSAIDVSGSRVVIGGQVFVAAAPANSSRPAVQGASAREGVEQRCDPGSWDAAPSFSYAWLRDGDLIDGAVSRTYVPVAADVGRPLACRVTGTNELGSDTATSDPVTVSAGVPVVSSPPEVTGPPVAGRTLTATTGTWSNAPDAYAYEWRVDGEPAGSALATYTVAPEDAGKDVTVLVTATNAVGDGAPSESVPRRIAAVPVSQAAPTIAGAPAVGTPLTAVPGVWSGDPESFAYAWLRDGVAIGGATGSSYTPVDDDEGTALSVRVTAFTAAGASSPATSPAVTVPLPAAPLTTITPLITGSGFVGSPLSCEPGSFTGKGTITIDVRWLRAGRPIPGADGRSYTPTLDDVGRTVTCEERATNKGGVTVAHSAPVAPAQVVLEPQPPGVVPPAVIVAPFDRDALAALIRSQATLPRTVAAIEAPPRARRGRKAKIRVLADGVLTDARLLLRRRGRTYATVTAKRVATTGSMTLAVSRKFRRGTYELRFSARDAGGRLVTATDTLAVD